MATKEVGGQMVELSILRSLQSQFPHTGGKVRFHRDDDKEVHNITGHIVRVVCAKRITIFHPKERYIAPTTTKSHFTSVGDAIPAISLPEYDVDKVVSNLKHRRDEEGASLIITSRVLLDLIPLGHDLLDCVAAPDTRNSSIICHTYTGKVIAVKRLLVRLTLPSTEVPSE